MRIASLLASATEIVCALGLEADLVAISHECDYPAAILDRPRISRSRIDADRLPSGAIDAAVRGAAAEGDGVYVLDEEAFRRADPDLVLAQAVCDVCAVPTSLVRTAAAVLDRQPTVLSLDAHGIEEILETVVRVGEATGTRPAADRVLAGLRSRMASVTERIGNARAPGVLVLEWLDPVFVPGHWGPEMVERAGGTNLAGSASARSSVVTWADLAQLDPEVLVVAPCGFGLARALEEADRFRAQLRAVAPRAVAAGTVYALDGSSYLNRSGPRVVDGIEILAALFHPERFPDVPLPGRAARWVPDAADGAGRG